MQHRRVTLLVVIVAVIAGALLVTAGEESVQGTTVDELAQVGSASRRCRLASAATRINRGDGKCAAWPRRLNLSFHGTSKSRFGHNSPLPSSNGLGSTKCFFHQRAARPSPKARAISSVT